MIVDSDLRQLLDQPAPCADCLLANLCARNSEACDAYAAFVGGASKREWMKAPRVPSRKIYDRILGGA